MRFSVEDGKQLGIGGREGTVNLATLLRTALYHTAPWRRVEELTSGSLYRFVSSIENGGVSEGEYFSYFKQQL